MHMDELPRAGPLMQVVDVLRDHQHLPRPVAFEQGEGAMTGVRRDVGIEQRPPPGVVEGLHAHGVGDEGLRRRYILQPHLGPDAIGITERVETGFLRDAGAGEDDDAFRQLRARHGHRISTEGRAPV
jgi:hypothetical protein